jgi:hypothetical protein
MVSGGKEYSTNSVGNRRNCNDIQPAASPCGNLDTLKRVLRTKGVSKQVENVSVEVSGGRTEGCRT